MYAKKLVLVLMAINVRVVLTSVGLVDDSQSITKVLVNSITDNSTTADTKSQRGEYRVLKIFPEKHHCA